ncbi:hypothetical protein C5167_016839 [Papaver somniferum]|uniref:Uncharacterized protein n=1 Tax=Papaver somniferum TaxID=3469 RepID=A0A4Y7IL05_PAPSO|nr:hypothetical protein C5167_016839 [Papaver somniferum]
MVQKVTKFLSSIGHHFAPISPIMTPFSSWGQPTTVFVLLFILWRLHRAAQSCNCTMCLLNVATNMAKEFHHGNGRIGEC